jgi:nucleoside 2-deoxyribosyltransferase
MTLKVYVASSWRNQSYAGITQSIRENGHAVLDWRVLNAGFRWPPCPTLPHYVSALETDADVDAAYRNDRDAIDACDVVVLLNPCGSSAHLEAGYASGRGKPVIVMLVQEEPLRQELMYKLLGENGGVRYVTSTAELIATLRAHEHDASAQLALELGQRDVARAIKILQTFTGMPLDTAITAIEEAAGLNDGVAPSAPIEEEPL